MCLNVVIILEKVSSFIYRGFYYSFRAFTLVEYTVIFEVCIQAKLLTFSSGAKLSVHNNDGKYICSILNMN